MNPVFLYLIKASVFLFLFYAFYRIFLQKETWSFFNRFYLLFTLLLSVVLPLVSIPQSSLPLPVVNFQLGEVTIHPDAANVQGQEIQFSIENLILRIYTIIVIVFLARFLFCIFRIFRIRWQSESIEGHGKRIYITPDIPSSFSFGSWIFLDEGSSGTNRRNIILQHELAHTRQLHSVDLLIAGIYKAFFWFNPVAWSCQKALQEVHEYLADREVLNEGTAPSDYMGVLIQQIDLSHPLPISNHFNQSLLKRRFIMLSKSKSGLWHAVRAGLLTPVLLISCILVINGMQKTTYAQDTKKSEVKKADKPAKTAKSAKSDKSDKSDNDVYNVVKNMPQHSGGQEAYMKHIQANLKYPDKAIKQGIMATVYVNFVISETGDITNVKVLRAKEKPLKDKSKKISDTDLKAALDEMSREAVRVVSTIPGKWTPGSNENGKPVKVYFTIPIKFELN